MYVLVVIIYHSSLSQSTCDYFLNESLCWSVATMLKWTAPR